MARRRRRIPWQAEAGVVLGAYSGKKWYDETGDSATATAQGARAVARWTLTIIGASNVLVLGAFLQFGYVPFMIGGAMGMARKPPPESLVHPAWAHGATFTAPLATYGDVHINTIAIGVAVMAWFIGFLPFFILPALVFRAQERSMWNQGVLWTINRPFAVLLSWAPDVFLWIVCFMALGLSAGMSSISLR
jgi:hypothetical protein